MLILLLLMMHRDAMIREIMHYETYNDTHRWLNTHAFKQRTMRYAHNEICSLSVLYWCILNLMYETANPCMCVC